MQLDLVELVPVVCKNIQGILLHKVELLLEIGIRKMCFQIGRSRFFIFSKSHIADTFWSRGNDDIAKRTFGIAVIYRKTLAAVFKFSRSHSLNLDKQVVQPSGTGKPGLMRSIKQSSFFFF
ncbi:hypothetical protein D9M72_492440 [compost metagenome]